MIAAADRALADDESSERSYEEAVRKIERGPYKTHKGKPVMTPEQRKKAKAARDRRYKEKKKTEAAQRRAQEKKDFAKLCFSAPQTGKGRKQADREQLIAAQQEIKALRADNAELKKKEAARASKPSIQISAARAALFNDAWRMLEYLSRVSNRLTDYEDASKDADYMTVWHTPRVWLR